MEEVIKIEGGRKLRGSVRISGSKNSTVALIPAAILGSEPVTIYGVPHTSDVKQLFFSKGRRCLSYMTSWNESEKKFFTFEEARDIRSLLDRPARIEVC